MDKSNRKLYFTAGPAKIPDEVLAQVRDELLDFRGMGISVMEMSHRSKEFGAILEATESSLRKLIKVPDNYAILFMHGGAKSQFDSVPMNLCSSLNSAKVEYLVNGSWSKMAANDADKYAQLVMRQNLNPASDGTAAKFTRQFTPEELVELEKQNQDNKLPAYRFYCDNETIEGVEWNYAPVHSKPDEVPLVADMTSNLLSKPIDVSKYGIIFAGAQKNCGLSGLTIVIVRRDLIGKHMPITPTIQTYQKIEANRSCLNTPLTFAIYVAGLCAKWALDRGGLEGVDKLSKQKSAILYDLIDNSQGFYTNPVDKSSRSRMNVVFLLANKELESSFLKESEAANLYDLKGHRSVGGFRASIYNGITVDDVRRLARFMDDFRRRHTQVDQELGETSYSSS